MSVSWKKMSSVLIFANIVLKQFEWDVKLYYTISGCRSTRTL